MLRKKAKFGLGQVVKHKMFPIRGVIVDIDPKYSNTEEWWQAIPKEIRPKKDQPFYHLLAENSDSHYMAYVSEQNLVKDTSGEPVDHPEVDSYFGTLRNGKYDLEVKPN